MLFPFPIFLCCHSTGLCLCSTDLLYGSFDFITSSLSHLTQCPSFHPREVAQQPELSLGSRSYSFLTALQGPQGFFLTLPGKLLCQWEEPHNLPSVACGSGSVASRGLLWSNFLCPHHFPTFAWLPSSFASRTTLSRSHCCFLSQLFTQVIITVAALLSLQWGQQLDYLRKMV